MNYTNKYLRNFKPYKAASHKIWTVSKEERIKMLKLDWNESTIYPSPLVQKRLQKIVNDGSIFNLYPATCNEELIELLSKYANVPTENIQYFGSSDSLQEYIAKLFIAVGDPVVIVWPTYDNFRLTAETQGGRVFYFNFNNDFSFDSISFERFIEEKEATVVYICNPNNPTGFFHKSSYIKRLLLKFPETLFLVDEAYIEFTEVKDSCVKLATEFDNLLVSRTMSKAFGIANFRFGYLIASKKNIDYITRIRNPKNITTFAQEAAIAVLQDIPYMERYVAEVRKAKEYFISELRKMKKLDVFDSEGNFVMMKLSSAEEKKELFNYLICNNIFVRDINQSPLVYNCLRVSIGTTEQMRIVVNAIRTYYEQ